MGWQPRRRPPRFSPAVAVVTLLLSLVAICSHRNALAADVRESPGTDVSKCPEPDVVWAISAGFVPSAAGQLLAARSRVEISDFGTQYRVRVATPAGMLERVYVDPERDCGRRARFVAEFILLALMPPHLAAERPPPEPQEAASPATRVQAPAVVRESGPGARKDILRIELAAIGTVAPAVLNAPTVLAWGADLRFCVGTGTFGAIAGVGYAPSAGFVLSDLHGSVTRVPAIVGLRARAIRPQFQIAGDLVVAMALERYAGTSTKTPREATRFAPGVEAGILVSTGSASRLAPFVSIRCMLVPITNGLGATPEGVLGKTPSLWVGAALGLSLAL